MFTLLVMQRYTCAAGVRYEGTAPLFTFSSDMLYKQRFQLAKLTTILHLIHYRLTGLICRSNLLLSSQLSRFASSFARLR